MEMMITFPGGKRVDAQFDGYTLPTDQPVNSGGEGRAPAPFDLFLASLGTCAGIYVLGFCQQRGIDTTGLSIRESIDFNSRTHLVEKVTLSIQLPDHFPEKYRSAVISAANLCTVKRHLDTPPEIAVVTQS
ncbi:MAG: osmotically inducible protein OsmC [FCB group bacterium]|nr:osmotically inducible protein OsmC [FCB group bacterium]